MVPSLRIEVRNSAPVGEAGDYVLYWMIAARRARYNFALERAVEWVRELRKPLLVFEPLRCAYPWASDRLHHFLLEGMAANAKDFARSGALYFPYVETRPDGGKGLLASLAAKASVVVTDEFPCYMYPRMTQAAARQVAVRMEQVDSNGLLPLRCSDRAFPSAYLFRRFLQKSLPQHLADVPRENPLRGMRLPRLSALPAGIAQRWPRAAIGTPEERAELVAKIALDRSVTKSQLEGGADAGRRALMEFLLHRLRSYATERNHPDAEGSSGLSPYLHFGHISAHEVFAELLRSEDWSVDALENTKPTGKRCGWWSGMSEPAEEFLDQLITWRELGYNFCFHRADYDRFESLPDWARRTLQKHSRDRREHVYTLAEFEASSTHDPLWNAAQRQLVTEGRLHNYLRMLWGKKILEWSRTPEDALAVMIELNNKYALDGRDPNSYSGIFWVLGRYDRPWGPERRVFGTIRYMSSENTARKVRVREYLRKYSADGRRVSSR